MLSDGCDPPFSVCARLRQRRPDGDCVPVVMRDTIGFLSEQGGSSSVVVIPQIEHDNRHWIIQGTLFFCVCVSGLEIEGIFRRSANVTLVKEVQLKYNSGRSTP